MWQRSCNETCPQQEGLCTLVYDARLGLVESLLKAANKEARFYKELLGPLAKGAFQIVLLTLLLRGKALSLLVFIKRLQGT